MLALKEGRPDAAVEAALDLGDFGSRVQNSGCTLVGFLLGVACKRGALKVLKPVVVADGLDATASDEAEPGSYPGYDDQTYRLHPEIETIDQEE